MVQVKEKISRDLLRSMKDGEQVSVVCADGYDLASQRSTVHDLGTLENISFSTFKSGDDGLTLVVTRNGRKLPAGG